MIDAVGAPQVVSNFNRQQYVGDQIRVAHVEHVEHAGATKVETVVYVTYTAQGRNEEPYNPAGSTVDIII